MEIKNYENAIGIEMTDTNLDAFIQSFTTRFEELKNNNLIVDISLYQNLSKTAAECFLPFAKKHKKAKKSFVLLTSEVDFNAVSDKLNLVRSLQEAHDIIEMEEIERDLGF